MSIRFIVIDDAPFIRELLKNIACSAGAIFVGEASDGVEGLNVVEKTLPDLVFLDMVMPKQNGLVTAVKIKDRIPNIKIIGCSTLDTTAAISKALSEGFDAYVTKPFTKQQVIFEIENLFPQQREATNE